MKRTRLTILTTSLAAAIALGAPAAFAADSLPKETTAATGESYYLNAEGTHYVPTREAVETPFADLDSAVREKSVAVDHAATAGLLPAQPAADQPAQEVPAGEGAPAEKPFTREHVDPDSDHPVAAGLVALPSVLTIEGSTYYLNADGETYVTDVACVSESPTQDEVTASNKLLAQHSAEVARQALAEVRAGNSAADEAGAAAEAPQADTQRAAYATPVVEVGTTAAAAQDAPAAQDVVAEARGIGAETGSNAVARALAALLVASLVGAAVFAYGRRRLV
ncbi:hypothetical protein [Corynebacterium sp.]|uniref:hypothetical protein n=1 Tax=Corynebacterium sp. TaxID=1720 RepID=UPI002A9103F9|nr:hypothetical protein [Corynebacterium sp.]MDY5785538.1 hypothetical protein [Corynebacterium sp.]